LITCPVLRRVNGRNLRGKRRGAGTAGAGEGSGPYPHDGDAVAALRLAARNALAAGAGRTAAVRTLLSGARMTVTASGERPVSARVISGVAVTGDHAAVQFRTVVLAQAASSVRTGKFHGTWITSRGRPPGVLAGREEELARLGQVLSAGENVVGT
jgi:hypothetical protein